MVTRAEWIEKLRSLNGVRFLHQGRTRAGVDCFGLVSLAASELGLHTTAGMEVNGYDNTPDSKLFEKKLHVYLEPVPYNRLQPLRTQAKPGDILIFSIERSGVPRHIAVYTGVGEHGYDQVIHSYAKSPRCVMEMQLDPGYWNQRLISVWKVPGLED